MFEKVLIANRGEIACRVAQTCQRLGVRSVAVYSDADAEARHVALCDEAFRIGPAPARDSYLKADAILEVARRSGAEAIHPGYGFLSENAAFAEACMEAGVLFIGPPPAAIRAMGSKSAAKTIMEEAGVPLVPGYHGTSQTLKTLAAAAETISYPVLIKASAGGGGKGMRVVEAAAALKDAIASAKREAAASFGDDRLLVEKYLLEPRHIEFQVFADTQGNALHLFERDCSVQRRHQKVLEEAPAPGMTETRRREMGAAAVAAAKAIDYVGAGTVEFIVDRDGAFYFMEMNTRLQVEHPVTEMITGQDLVEWQLRVAGGEPLPIGRQDQLSISGHAFEARVYAEDPERDFLPATGKLRHLRTPREGPHVRVDTGVRAGDEVSVHYDPMIAKLIVWGSDRGDALRRLRGALADYQVVGVTTNLAFLAALSAHPAFASAEVDTAFIDRHRADLFPEKAPLSDRILALATLGALLRIERLAAEAAAQSADPWSPWHSRTGWRMNDDNHYILHLHEGDSEIDVTAHYRPDHYLLELPGGTMRVRGEWDDNGDLLADLEGARQRATLVRRDDELVIISQGESHALRIYDPLLQGQEQEEELGSLVTPMPGTVIAILVAVGDSVSEGAPLMILEAMKMEQTITAPHAGTVDCINFSVGEQVEGGVALLSLQTEGQAEE